MFDSWSTQTKHLLIIGFMVNSDRNMIYHSFINCTNKKKNANFVVSLTDHVVNEIGEQNIVQIITNSDSKMKAIGEQLMKQRSHSEKRIS